MQKDNKLINSLSSDNEELHLKKRIFFGGNISCWTAFIINNNFPALDFGVWILAS